MCNAATIPQPVKIDPDSWYVDAAARMLLDLPGSTLARARRAGELPYARRGPRVWYRGAWLIAWLENGKEVARD